MDENEIDGILPPMSFCFTPTEPPCSWCKKLAVGEATSGYHVHGWRFCDDHIDIARESFLYEARNLTFNVFGGFKGPMHFYRARNNKITKIDSFAHDLRLVDGESSLVKTNFERDGDNALTRDVVIYDIFDRSPGLFPFFLEELEKMKEMIPDKLTTYIHNIYALSRFATVLMNEEIKKHIIDGLTKIQQEYELHLRRKMAGIKIAWAVNNARYNLNCKLGKKRLDRFFEDDILKNAQTQKDE